MSEMTEDVRYWVNEFRTDYADQATSESDRDLLEDGVESIIERALESFESELRTALEAAVDDLMDQIEELEREKVCSACGLVLTDENRPDGSGWYGPGSGYCGECAAANE